MEGEWSYCEDMVSEQFIRGCMEDAPVIVVESLKLREVTIK